VELEELAIEGAWRASSPIHTDDRGSFREWFKSGDFELLVGRKFEVAQSNISTSHRGVIRGIHYSTAPQGQAKWVTCVSGSIWDVIVDLRPSSPTFKKWIGLPLHGNSGDAVFVSEGLGHGFISLEENSVVSYLLTTSYSPEEEFEINPMDIELAIQWPGTERLISAKDASAPTLAERLAEGRLPR
jgi:dTDP-4-dehydrorhamnose 3,5-epimerase